MDVWIVAAAAGAGYAVKHLKNLSRGKNKCLDMSSENLSNVKSRSRHNVEDESYPFRCVFSRKKFMEEMSNGEREKAWEAASDFETSTSGYEDENLVMRDRLMSYKSVSNSTSLALIQEDSGSRLPSDSMYDLISGFSPFHYSSEIGFASSSRRKISLKSRKFNSQFIKPQTSLENCLMAQLYEHRQDIEEYARHPLGKPFLRPFLVTDGSKIISTGPRESFSIPIGTGKCQLVKHGYLKANATVCGIPRLPNVVPTELGNKAKTRDIKKHNFGGIDSSKGGCEDHDNAQGTSDRVLLFFLGLTMGVVSSFLANKQELEKMKCLLKQSENLVQDLQEELEMKDSLTVKELAAEVYESRDVHTDRFVDDTVHSLSVEEKLDEEYCCEKAEKKSLNEIEAELEAELQMLESTMNSSSLEGKCTTGLDQDLVPVSHEGKLWPNSFDADTNNELHADRNGSRSSTPRSCYYAVSPRELSLRLHQLIQSRLEERVKELEMALQNSQRKVEYMESEQVHPWRELSNSKTQTLQIHDSPVTRDGFESVEQPVFINLSGEALAAYSEAYEELTKVSESDDEDLQVEFENSSRVQNDCVGRHSSFYGHHKTVFDQLTEEDHYSLVNDIECSSTEEAEDGDQEEMERLLIRQIVEKAKEGSPAVLKAQRAFLLSNIENEH